MKEQYINVPVSIIGDPRLPGSARTYLYCFIKSICDSGKTCAASNKYLAELLHTSEGVIRVELCRLKKFGFISVTKNGSRRELKAFPVGENALTTVNNNNEALTTVNSVLTAVNENVNSDSYVTDTILTNTSSSSNPAEPTTTTTDSDSSLANEKEASRASVVRKIQQFQLKHNLIHSVKFCEGLLDKLMDEIRLAHPDVDDSVVITYADNYVNYRLDNEDKIWDIKGANENYNLVDCYQRAWRYTHEDSNKAEDEEAAKKAAEKKAKEDAEYRRKYEENAKKMRAINKERTTPVWLRPSTC